MSHHEPGSDDMAWIEWPRWVKALGFAAAVLALVAAIVGLGVAAVLVAGG